MDDHGMTPLHWAAIHPERHEKLLRLLVDGADIRAKTTAIVANIDPRIPRPDGATFLHSERHPDLPEGIGFDKGSNPLHVSARMGNAEAVRSLLDYRARSVKNSAGGTAVHLAALAGSERVVRMLLDHGFKTDDTSRLKKSVSFYDVGMTPILCALESGDLATVDALLDASADLSITTKFGCGAVFFAARGGSDAVLERVLGCGINVPSAGRYMNFPLVEAVASGNVAVVRRLLAAGSPTEEGRAQSPLRLATERNLLEIREALLDSGARPLEHGSACAAARSNDVMDLRARIEKGEDISASVDGMTPLMHAACMDFEEAACTLVEGGADLDVLGANGTALHYGISNQAWRVVRRLVHAGADCALTDQHGNDAMLSAVIRGAPSDVLSPMLGQGANPHVYNKHGINALTIIARDRPQDLPMFQGHGEPRSFDPFSAPTESLVLSAATDSTSWKKLHGKLWDELVPPSGPCASVQGELIRCIGRLTDEAYRNGNMNFDDGYRFMITFIETTITDDTLTEDERRSVRAHCSALRAHHRIETSGDGSPHYRLNELVVRWCIRNPELRAYKPSPRMTR